MAFTWTNSIDQGSPASVAALQEIRNNLDYIDNNLACISHDSTYKSGHDGTVKSSYNSSQDSSANGTIHSYADGAIYTGANATVNSGHNTSVVI